MIAFSALVGCSGRDDIPVAVRNGEILTFGTLRRQVACLRDWVAGRPEGFVALVDEDGFRFAAGLLAALHAGRTPILLPNDRPGTIRDHSGSGVLVLTEEIYRAAQARDAGAGYWDTLDPETLLVFLTSGSTGKPKEVRKRLRQLEAEVENLERTWGEAMREAIALATVPHRHIYGLLFKILWPLSAGRGFFSRTVDYWETAFDLMSRHRAAVVSSPSHLTRFPVLEPVAPEARPALVFSSGAPLPVQGADACDHMLGTRPFEVFGSTETGGIAYRQQFAPDTPWAPFHGIAVRAGGDGILEIRSPYLETEDWSGTSDRVVFVDGDRFVLGGRADRVVKVEGKRVSLTEVENLLMATSWVRDAAALVLDDARGSLAAVAVLTGEGRDLRVKEGTFRFSRRLKAELGFKLDPVACPRRWRFVDEIPTNKQGKRTLEALRAPFESAPAHRTWQASRHLPEVRSRLKSGSMHEFTLFVPGNLFQLQGHFPGWPILPGVAQLDWAIRFAEEAFERPLAVQEVHNLKFLRTVAPEAVLTLRLEGDLANGRVRFEFADDGGRVSFGILKARM